MDRFKFQEQAKYALVAVNNVYTDLPHDEDYNYTLTDGTWIFCRLPISIADYWKEELGTIHLETLKESNFIMLYSEISNNPMVQDGHHVRLRERISLIFYLLQLSGILEYNEANLLCGSFFKGKPQVLQEGEFPFFHNTKGYTRVPVTIERLEKAAQLRKVCEKIDSVLDDFKRLKRGWSVLKDGWQKKDGDERIHQFVRSLEALILPEIGRTKRQFVHRCQTFAKASQNTNQILEEAFDLRSMAEHLNDWEQALRSYPKDDREIVALHRTRQMEQLASFAYSRILESRTVRNHFINEKKLGQFWGDKDDKARTNIWGTQLDLTLIREVRKFDNYGRALPNP